MKARTLQVLTIQDIKDRSTMDGDCWVYNTDAKTEHHRKYAQVKHKGQHFLARRLAYELARGELPVDARVVPCCGNPYCIFPWHQEAMTESEKQKVAAERGAFSSIARGKKIAESRRAAQSKLTEAQAMEIRASSESGPVLAKKYGINRSRVNAIKRGDAWKDYSNPFAGLMSANDAGRRQA
mgnify:FL=1